jgi:hypothetical protein
MRKIIHKLIMWYYRKEFREITKILPEEELQLYLFKDSDTTLRLIRAETTRYVLKEFEEWVPEKKWMAKGAALALRQIRDAHLAVFEIHAKTNNPDEQMKAWQKMKNRIFTN